MSLHKPRFLFGLFVVLGFAFIAYGTVSMVTSYLVLGSSDEVVELPMRVVKNRWLWDPNVIVVPHGALVRLEIENEDNYAHGFAIREYGIDRRLEPGQTTLIQFIADKEGEFEFFCSVFCGAGHFDQKGTLVVTTEDIATVVARYTRTASGDLPVRSRLDAIDRLPFTLTADGYKEFELTAEAVMWDYGNGRIVESWGYNGQLPGPEIRVTEGDKVRIIFTNYLPLPTTVHWHGLDVPNRMDGVPGYTQPPVNPGETFVYEFTAYPGGTRFYHTHGSNHGDEALQLDMGLAGPFIVEPKDFVAPDVDYTMVLTERIREGIYPINGAIYPDTEFVRIEEGQLVRFRLINAGSSTFHPMHLHGHQFKVVAVDGNPIPEVAQLTRNTLPLLPGETYDIEFVADNSGIWLFHCHELQHAGGGMITAVVYQDEFAIDFELTDHNGSIVNNSVFEDTYTLVGFGYTSCPDICALTIADMDFAIQSVMDQVPVQGIFVTIDPARDTPERLQTYVRNQSAYVVGVTGSQEQIDFVADAFRVYFTKVGEPGDPDYSMDHGTTVYLLGPGGRFIATFAHETSPEKIVQTILRDQVLQGGLAVSVSN